MIMKQPMFLNKTQINGNFEELVYQPLQLKEEHPIGAILISLTTLNNGGGRRRRSSNRRR
jgi:hypothetical protein